MSEARTAGTHCRYGVPRTVPLAMTLLVVAAALLSSAHAATTVYRTVDAEGRVTFSDAPPAKGEKGEAVEVREPMSFEPPPTAPAGSGEAWQWDMTGNPEADEQAVAYTGISVIAPAYDEGVRENAGTVTVVMGVEPGLQPGDVIEVLLDGQPVATAGGNQVTLSEVERGTHSLLARVVDPGGAVLIESEVSTFHMLRYVPLTAPNRPKPPKPTPKPKTT